LSDSEANAPIRGLEQLPQGQNAIRREMSSFRVQGNRIWAQFGGIGTGLPPPLAGEGWGEGVSALGLSRICRVCSCAVRALTRRARDDASHRPGRVGLSRKRERRSKPAASPATSNAIAMLSRGAEFAVFWRERPDASQDVKQART
jgi:hypothetical protein